MAEKGLQIEDIAKHLCKVKCILSDVEGTTTSIPFVRNTLKSYFLDHLSNYLKEHWESRELQDILLKVKYESDSADPIASLEEAEDYIRKGTDSDHITYSYRLLQTKIWEEGYLSGELKGHLFPDVIPAFKRWFQMGKRIYLYSSGLEWAQKLLFSHSTEGDVLELVEGCFDTTIGSKYECDSYMKILEKLECKPEEVIFFSDSQKEADAALKAGIISVIMQRDGNASVEQKCRDDFPVASSFEEIILIELERKNLKMKSIV